MQFTGHSWPCAVAEALVRHALDEAGDATVIGATPLGARPTAATWRADAPSPALSAAFESQPAQSALHACPRLVNWLDARQVGYGDGIVRQMAEAAGPGGDYAAQVVTVALPVVSADGLEALAFAARASGPGAPVRSLVHLRRTVGGPWRVTEQVDLPL